MFSPYIKFDATILYHPDGTRYYYNSHIKDVTQKLRSVNEAEATKPLIDRGVSNLKVDRYISFFTTPGNYGRHDQEEIDDYFVLDKESNLCLYRVTKTRGEYEIIKDEVILADVKQVLCVSLPCNPTYRNILLILSLGGSVSMIKIRKPLSKSEMYPSVSLNINVDITEMRQIENVGIIFLSGTRTILYLPFRRDELAIWFRSDDIESREDEARIMEGFLLEDRMDIRRLDEPRNVVSLDKLHGLTVVLLDDRLFLIENLLARVTHFTLPTLVKVRQFRIVEQESRLSAERQGLHYTYIFKLLIIDEIGKVYFLIWNEDAGVEIIDTFLEEGWSLEPRRERVMVKSARSG